MVRIFAISTWCKAFIKHLGLMLISGFLFCVGNAATASDIVRIIDIDKVVDPQKDYFISVLELALEKSEQEYGSYEIQLLDLPMYQERQLQSLNQDIIDVVWTMTTQNREERFMPARIPLMRGLIGFRISMILKGSQGDFDTIVQTDDLKRRIALQGHDWPDTQILRDNGYRVRTTSTYDSFFSLLKRPGIHHIPRGLLEGEYELAMLDPNEYALESQHVLVYPSAIYFFTSYQNQRLNERIEHGLRNALDDGSFDEKLFEYEMHKPVLSHYPMKGRQVHCLQNPLLPKIFPIHEEGLWMGSMDADYAVCGYTALKGKKNKKAPQIMLGKE